MRAEVLLSLLLAALLGGLSLLGHPYVYCDQALQLDCVQTWQRGGSSFPNWVVMADPADLARNRFQWEIWHAPAFPVLIALLGSAGIPFGIALQIVALITFMAGCMGWTLWAGRFDLPRTAQLAFPFLLAGIRYANDNLVHFHAETFIFGLTPWFLLGALKLRGLALAPPKYPRLGLIAGSFGLLLGLSYLFKYNALFVIIGVLAMLGEIPKKIGALILLLAALPIIALSILNRLMGGTENLVTASWQPHFSASSLLYLLGNIPLMLADAGQPIEHLWSSSLVVPLLGLPGAFLMVELIFRAAPRSGIERLTLRFAATQLVLMLTVWTLCQGVGFDRRYLAPAALALLPLVLARTLKSLREDPGFMRTVAAAFLLFYLFLPVAYGYTTLVMKVIEAASYHYAGNKIWDPVLTEREGRAVETFLTSQLHDRDRDRDLWYLPEPIFALGLPGRKLIGHAGWGDAWITETYHTNRLLRMLALAPAELDDAAAQQNLHHLFPQSSTWKKTPVPQANYMLWTTLLDPKL